MPKSKRTNRRARKISHKKTSATRQSKGFRAAMDKDPFYNKDFRAPLPSARQRPE